MGIEKSVQENAITKKDFLTCIREAKSISITEKKQFNRVSRSKIMRTRLAQLYVMGVYTTRQISDIMGVNVQTVYKMLKEKEVLDMLNAYATEEKNIIDVKLKSLRDRATDTLSELLGSDEDSVRLQTAKVILDKTGHGDRKEIEQNINVSYEQRLGSVLEGVSFNVEDLEYAPTHTNE